jgi:non-ribosomal peptide synthase protein (TIGR01720 family)
MAVARRRGGAAAVGHVLVDLEGHGRQTDAVPGSDLSRTVGWFTTTHPVRFGVPTDLDGAFAGGAAAGSLVKAVKEARRSHPDDGLGWGLLRYLDEESASRLRSLPTPQIGFNYLGRLGGVELADEVREQGFLPAAESLDVDVTPGLGAGAALEINVEVVGSPGEETLRATFGHIQTVLGRPETERIASAWVDALGAIAVHAGGEGAGGLTPSDLDLVEVDQATLDMWEAKYPTLRDVWPLAPLQRGMFFHALLAEGGADVYTAQVSLELGGRVDSVRLRAAADGLLARHANLRAAFVADDGGRAHQLILDDVRAPWREVDVREFPEAQRSSRVAELIATHRSTPYRMDEAPLMRFLLVRTGDDTATLSVANHHILLDGWSLPLVVRDLLVLYVTTGDVTNLPAVRGFDEHLRWLARHDDGSSRAAWEAALAGLDEPTVVAPDAATAAVDLVPAGRRVELPGAVARGLDDLTTRLGVTMNTVVQAAWGLVVAHTLGRDDVVFGATVSGRPADLPGVEQMVGLFINTIPVRVRRDPAETTDDLLRRIQREQADLLDHHQVPLTDVQRTAGTGAVFDTLTIFESYPVDAAAAAVTDLDGMTVLGTSANDASHYPLSLVAQQLETLDLTLKYQPPVVDDSRAEAIAGQVARVLADFVDARNTVGRLDLFDAGQRADTERLARGQTRVVDDRDIAEIIADVVDEDPDAVAISVPGPEGVRTVTRAGISAAVNRLARHLIDMGVGPDQAVGVMIPRSVEQLVAIRAGPTRPDRRHRPTCRGARRRARRRRRRPVRRQRADPCRGGHR